MATQVKPRPMQAHICSRCSSDHVAARRYKDTVTFKALTFDVDGLIETQCSNCGLSWTSQEQDNDNLARMRAVFIDKRDEVRARDGLLTGDQIETILRELGLNRTQAAAVFGGGPNAFAKYIAGEVLQSVAMDRLLRLAQRVGTPAVAFLRDVRAPVEVAMLPAGAALGAFAQVVFMTQASMSAAAEVVTETNGKVYPLRRVK